jgi:hypothetical protein
MQKTFQVTPEFKERITELLQKLKYGTIFPYMNLINREGFIYTEDELNSFIALLSEFPYAEVAEFFATIKQNVIEVNEGQEVSTEN